MDVRSLQLQVNYQKNKRVGTEEALSEERGARVANRIHALWLIQTGLSNPRVLVRSMMADCRELSIGPPVVEVVQKRIFAPSNMENGNAILRPRNLFWQDTQA